MCGSDTRVNACVSMGWGRCIGIDQHSGGPVGPTGSNWVQLGTNGSKWMLESQEYGRWLNDSCLFAIRGTTGCKGLWCPQRALVNRKN